MPDSSLQNISILPQNRYPESFSYLEKGLHMATEQGNLLLQSLIQNDISQNYEAQGKYAEAHEAFKKYIVLKDSISGDEVQKKITRSEIQYEYDKKELALKYEKQLTEEQLANQLLLTIQQKQDLTLKEKDLELSNQEKDITQLAFLKEQAEKQEKAQQLALSEEREKTKGQDLALKNIELTAQQKQNLYLGAFIFLLLCGLGALIYFYQTMRKQKNIIAQQNQLNEHTISILSHDIKEPLLGVKLLLKKLHVNDPFLSQASLSLENQISSVNGVLNNLLNMKKMSMGENQKNATANVKEVIQNIITQMHPSIQEKNITVQNLLPADFNLPIAAEKLQVVVHNLLSNAIKYSHPDQSIKIYKEGNGFCIQDFGVGLSDVQTIKLMTDVKNSKPGTTQEKGHGMGLFLVGMLLQGEQVRVIFESPEIGGTIVKIMG
jgi:signal transduction histidine kinase